MTLSFSHGLDCAATPRDEYVVVNNGSDNFVITIKQSLPKSKTI